MSDHAHSQYVAGCYRCDLSRDEVTSGYVTDALVERAAKAMTDDWSPDRHPILTAMFRDYASTALSTVVAPLIAAEALREAADGYQTGGWADDLPKGDSRPALILGMSQRAVAWLRARADRIEGGQP